MPAGSLDGLDTILSEIENGRFEFKRALEDIHMNVESRLAEMIGPAAGRLHTARSRNDQVATDFRLWIRAARRRRRRGARRLSACAGREGARACRNRDAGLHPSADRAAGDLRPPSPRLCRDDGARPRPVRRCAQAAERMSARRRGARRHCFSDRPQHDRQGARLRPADGELARCRVRPRLRAGSALGGGHRGGASVALRRGDRASGARRCSGSSRCRTASPPAPRSCRRSAIPMRPSWCAPRAGRIIGALAGAADRDEGPAARLPEGHAGGQGRRHGRLRRARSGDRGDDRHGRAT